MFRCQFCARVAPAGTACKSVVVQTRRKKYPERPKANRIWRPAPGGAMRAYLIDDPGGVGREIVRELRACPACAQQHGG